MSNPFEDNMKRSTADAIKSEVKKGIFWYIVATILSKIFAYVVTGVIMLLAVVTQKIYKTVLTDKEKEENAMYLKAQNQKILDKKQLEEDAYVIATLRDIQEGRITG